MHMTAMHKVRPSGRAYFGCTCMVRSAPKEPHVRSEQSKRKNRRAESSTHLLQGLNDQARVCQFSGSQAAELRVAARVLLGSD
jgi:hypothetical protein